MIQIHTLKTLDFTPRLRDRMFRDRKAQFSDRLKWEVVVDQRGREIDQYDNELSKYLIFTDESLNHIASVRLNRFGSNCMLEDHFSHEFPGISNMGPNGIEITRFCISPKTSPSQSKAVCRELFRVIYLHALEGVGANQLLGLCYRPMLRVYGRIGATPCATRLGTHDSKLILAQWNVTRDKFSEIIKQEKNQQANPLGQTVRAISPSELV